MFSPETRILVVDDMPTIRDLVKGQLKAMGYKNIIETSDGELGMKAVMDNLVQGTPVNLVISDWNMPRMSGLEFLRQVRALPETQNLPFVLLTSEAERDQVTEAIMAGVSQYVVKPFTAKVFDEKLRMVYQKHKGK